MWYAVSLQNCAFGATRGYRIKRLLIKADLTFAKLGAGDSGNSGKGD